MQPLKPWMKYLLRFAGCYNLLAGAMMLAARKDLFKSMGIEAPDLLFFVRLVGILVALFGVGYLMVAANPVQHRGVMLLGFLSKTLGSVLGIAYMLAGSISWQFLPILIISDIIYLPFFSRIVGRLYNDEAMG